VPPRLTPILDHPVVGFVVVVVVVVGWVWVSLLLRIVLRRVDRHSDVATMP